MIKHILKQIWAQRSANVWLWVELFLVSVFLWFIVDSLYVTAGVYFTPTGFNIEHTYKLALDEFSSESDEYIPADQKKTTSGEDLLMIINRIRAYPGIEAVSLSGYAYPYCGSNSYNNYQYDTTQVNMQRRKVTPEFFRVFRIITPDGKTEPLVSALSQERSIVISKDGERELMGEGRSILGSEITQPDIDSVGIKVTGVTSSMRYSEFRKKYPCVFFGIKEREIVKENDADFVIRAEICLRVSPEADHDFITHFRKDMTHQLRVGNVFLLDVQSFADIRDAYFISTGDFNELKTRLAIVAFLLVNIFLGIIGTFWFRTAYRRSEMGLRIALGSTRTSLRGMLIAEGLILLTFAIVPAAVVSFNIGHAELVDVNRMDFTFMRFFVGIVITYLLMIGMIILGIWYPARQAMKVQPAEVLHEE